MNIVDFMHNKVLPVEFFGSHLSVDARMFIASVDYAKRG
jgi:hypothetical protein